MKMSHIAIALALLPGLAACETAFSGPSSGQTAFVTTPGSCPDPFPIGSPDRNNGNETAFSDQSFRYLGC
jgi:hypothetical protein